MNLTEINRAIERARALRDARLLKGKYDHFSVVQSSAGLRVLRNDDLLSMHKVVWCTSRDGKGIANTAEVAA